MGSVSAASRKDLIHGKWFTNAVLAVVFLNAIVIGLQCYPAIDHAYGTLLRTIDTICLIVFAIEITLKIVIDRTKFFKDGWNLFDFVVVSVSLIFIGTQMVSMLRILRVLRILKAVTSVPALRRIVTSLFMAVPSISSVALLMCIVFYIYGVIGTTFYASVSPDYFGDLSRSLVTLFQIVTFDDWANIYRPISETSNFALLYFASFIMIAVFIMLNLVVGEIVNNASILSREFTRENETKAGAETNDADLHLLKQEVQALKQLLLEERQQRQYRAK